MRERERSIAILNPLGDYGISAYCHELAEGLEEAGVRADVYEPETARFGEEPRRHRRFPVIGTMLLKQLRVLRGNGAAAPPSRASYPDRPTVQPGPASRPGPAGRIRNMLRQRVLALEFALYLKLRGYDAVWTQWPNLHDYGTGFWRLCRLLGLQMIHTVHDVLPLEGNPGREATCRRVYESSDLLFVHSEWSRRELLKLFPQLAGKVAVMRHGTYTLYPRNPDVRERVRASLEIAADHVAILFCGGIRPYKNIDAVIESLADPECRRAVLVVAGTEARYPDSTTADPLGRTRRLAEKLGVAGRVRLIPRSPSTAEMAELFEAGDVLMLPYTEGYGSGMLLLGMTFGKHVVATRVGGAEEYLADYPHSTLLESAQPDDVARGLAFAIAAVDRQGFAAGVADPELAWPTVARSAVCMMGERFGDRG